MKLTEGFIAQLIKLTPNGHSFVSELAQADGVLFACPVCTAAGNPHAVICWFRGKVPDGVEPGPGRWEVSGTSLEDLTLHPSVWLKGVGCGWHGHVRNGEALLS